MMADMQRNQEASAGSSFQAADDGDNDGSDDDGPPLFEDAEVSK